MREWLQSLEKRDRYEIGTAVKTVEFGWPIGMPVCGAMGDGLWEVRASLAGRRIARVFFCVHEGHMVLLHGFLKTTQKTPKHDLALARNRKAKIESGETR